MSFVVLLHNVAWASQEQSGLHAPAPAVQKLIDKFNLEVVDFAYVQQMIGNGTRKGAKATLIDARPNAKYIKGTIPSSYSIPDTEFETYYSQVAELDKAREMIVFCGGWKCGKSPKVAGMLQEKGFTNVKVYQAGEPEWRGKSYLEVDTAVVEAAQKKNSALLLDARPYKKFLQATIAGSLALPDTEFDTLSGRLPVDKSGKIIAFCGGYGCGKSHKIAKILLKKGYTNVQVYAGGLPRWKEAGLATTGSAASKKPTAEPVERKVGANGIKPGVDEGTVDGEWFHGLLTANALPDNVVIVDVTPPEDFAHGHLSQAINIHAEALSAAELLKELLKDKVVVFNCTSGARALEAWIKLFEAKVDVSNVYYFDANITCDKESQCTIEVNEPLG